MLWFCGLILRYFVGPHYSTERNGTELNVFHGTELLLRMRATYKVGSAGSPM